jgi:hypothetical protein
MLSTIEGLKVRSPQTLKALKFKMSSFQGLKDLVNI